MEWWLRFDTSFPIHSGVHMLQKCLENKRLDLHFLNIQAPFITSSVGPKPKCIFSVVVWPEAWSCCLLWLRAEERTRPFIWAAVSLLEDILRLVLEELLDSPSLHLQTARDVVIHTRLLDSVGQQVQMGLYCIDSVKEYCSFHRSVLHPALWLGHCLVGSS